MKNILSEPRYCAKIFRLISGVLKNINSELRRVKNIPSDLKGKLFRLNQGVVQIIPSLLTCEKNFVWSRVFWKLFPRVSKCYPKIYFHWNYSALRIRADCTSCPYRTSRKNCLISWLCQSKKLGVSLRK